MIVCKAFPACSPLQVRRTRATEVFNLIARYNAWLRRQNLRNAGVKDKPGTSVRWEGGRQVVRRPAGDDWF